MNVLFSPIFYEKELPASEDATRTQAEQTNAMLLFTYKHGFVGLQPEGQLRDEGDMPLSPNVRIAFYDLEPPVEVTLDGTSYACVPGCGQSLRDPSISIHLLYQAERELLNNDEVV